jgi:TPR repeat protein
MRSSAAPLIVLALTCESGAACKRSHSSARQGEPAPSSSVISIGVALGTCDDIATCERECDAGSADRCRRLAASYAFGKGVDQNETQATALYGHACDMNDPSACVFAGQNYEFARGAPKNDATAARLYERACDLRWAPGCYNLAIMYERGTGVPASRERAGELYQVACTAGARQACDKAREMHEPPTPPFLDGGLP